MLRIAEKIRNRQAAAAADVDRKSGRNPFEKKQAHDVSRLYTPRIWL